MGAGRVWRVGMAGSGWVSQYHLPAWRKQAHRAEIVAIADPSEAALDVRRGQLGEVKAYNSADAMIDGASIDVVDIAPRARPICRWSGVLPMVASLSGDLAVHGEPQQARDQLRIHGSKATIVLDGYRLSCIGETTIVEEFDPVETYQGAYDSAIAHFLDRLESGQPFETAPADNLKTLALVEAAYANAVVHR